MLLFSRGREETGWGLLAGPCPPLPALARCRRGRLPAAAAAQRLRPRRSAPGSAPQKPPDRILLSAPRAHPAGLPAGEGFSLAGNREKSEICFYQPELPCSELQKMQLCAAPACWAGSQERGTLILDREEVSACPVLTFSAPMGTGQGR